MASSSLSQDRLTDKRACAEDDLENGGLSPQPSLRTNPQEDDICSEIVRIEQRDSQDGRSVGGLGDEDGTAFSRIVRTLQQTNNTPLKPTRLPPRDTLQPGIRDAMPEAFERDAFNLFKPASCCFSQICGAVINTPIRRACIYSLSRRWILPRVFPHPLLFQSKPLALTQSVVLMPLPWGQRMQCNSPSLSI
ncbi:hypothetical protein RRG08_039587 [Elysia crispata]|uniref:Uncharacterized protein n=1 Tax=Elysia crispata TaxID=231223 RepID=A0AAE1AJJ4_9GAST|nr:hypothetical protein RRG08_039587 [Elysia crispata]